jgi:hypothetical protein
LAADFCVAVSPAIWRKWMRARWGEPKLVVIQVEAKKVGRDQYFGKATIGSHPNSPLEWLGFEW